MASSQISRDFKLDLRSSGTARLRRGATVGWLRVFTLVVLDSLLLSFAWRLAEVVGTRMSSPWTGQNRFFFLTFILAVCIGMITAKGLYAPGDKRRDYLGLIQAVSLAIFLVLLTAFLYEPGEFVSRSTFLTFWFLSVCFVCTGRFLVEVAVEKSRKRGAIRYPVFLISDDDEGNNINLIERENRYDILGVANSRCLDRANRKATFEKIRELGVVEVFISWDSIKNRMFLCWHFQTAGITVHILPTRSEPILPKSELWIIGGQPSLTFPPPVITGSDFWAKRCFDFFGSMAL
ncbi:MAG TPA: hypothetical protein V6C65_38540, partial [Allocoleopsis sp.]